MMVNNALYTAMANITNMYPERQGIPQIKGETDKIV